MNEWAAAELQATCASLGSNDGVKYYPDVDAVECVKDLIRFLRRDDENHEVRRALGDLGVVKTDLVPILKEHSKNRELFDVTLRLLVNLTNPEMLLFKEELPEHSEMRNYYMQIQSHRQKYKEAFFDKGVWEVLANTLKNLLKKDPDERLEDDKLVLERILILIRNVLQVPTNVQYERRVEGDADMHDKVLYALHQAQIQDLMLYMASSDLESQYCLHVLEIITLMLKEQDPTQLATANLARSAEEKQADEEALTEAMRLRKEMQREKAKKIVSTRHNRFGGTFVVKNMKGVSDRDIVTYKPVHNLQSLDFDKSKRGLKKAKNRRTPDDAEVTRRSALTVRIFLKEFCIEFLMSAYNKLMNTVNYSLRRHSAQENDETYYLWAMKFFMEFNRNESFKIEYVSETMSKEAFHFLQQEIDKYRDMFEMEKRNRPKYLMWGRRIHLAIRAYNELLLNLVQMESSSQENLRESGRTIRASVFYMPEYRELCLQQLSSFNPDRMSMGYLKDLIHTTHVFLKLMEHMSTKDRLIVSKKTKKQKKKTKKGADGNNGPSEFQSQETRLSKEEKWDAVSGALRTLINGDGDLPTDVIPFDSTSSVPMEEQKLEAMKAVQRLLNRREADRALAMLRAAREVWPEGDAFGSADGDAEEEYIAMREILMADLGIDEEDTQDGNEGGNNGGDEGSQEGEIVENEEENEEEEEDEPEYKTYSVEQEFDFKGFVMRFAVKNVVMPYGHLFSNYSKNSKTTNHYIVKMFHRIAFDCGLTPILYQASIFRVFQRIWKDLRMKPKDQNLREIAKFAKFVLAHFMESAKTNKKLFMEMLFWKTSKDALELKYGYGSQRSSGGGKQVYWSEEDEERLKTVFSQMKEMHEGDPEVDILDQITLMFEHEKRTRKQIGHKLRALGLITSMKEITRKALVVKRVWSEHEVAKLTDLYHQYKDAEHPANRIYEQWKLGTSDEDLTKRSKRNLVDKILQLGLCDDKAKLGRFKKRGARRPKDDRPTDQNDSDSALDDSSSAEDDSSGEDDNSSEEEEVQSSAKKDLIGGTQHWLEFLTTQSEDAIVESAGKEHAIPVLEWLAKTMDEEGKDRADQDDDEDNDDMAIVPIEEYQSNAMASDRFQTVLESCGLMKPLSGEQYWRIPADMKPNNLKARAVVLKRIAEAMTESWSPGSLDREQIMVGVEPQHLEVGPRGLAAIKPKKSRKTKNKKREKRGPNKWMPFRRAPGSDPPPGGDEMTTSTPARKKKTSSKPPVDADSSDDEADTSKSKKSQTKSGKSQAKQSGATRSKAIDRSRIQRMLDSEDSSSSAGSGSEAPVAEEANDDSQKTKDISKEFLSSSSSSDEGVEDPTEWSSNPIKNSEKDREDAPTPGRAKNTSKTNKASQSKKKEADKKQPKKRHAVIQDDSSDEEKDNVGGNRSGSAMSEDDNNAGQASRHAALLSSDNSDNESAKQNTGDANNRSRRQRLVSSSDSEADTTLVGGDTTVNSTGLNNESIVSRTTLASSRLSSSRSRSRSSSLDDSRLRRNSSRSRSSSLSSLEDSRLSRKSSRSPSSRSTSPLSRRTSPSSRRTSPASRRTSPASRTSSPSADSKVGSQTGGSRSAKATPLKEKDTNSQTAKTPRSGRASKKGPHSAKKKEITPLKRKAGNSSSEEDIVKSGSAVKTAATPGYGRSFKSQPRKKRNVIQSDSD